MKFKPFYIKCEGVSGKQQQEVFDKTIKCGAYEDESADSYRSTFNYFGVNDDGCTFYHDLSEVFGNAVEITLDQVDEHLGLTTFLQEGTETFCGVEYRKGFMEALEKVCREYKV